MIARQSKLAATKNNQNATSQNYYKNRYWCNAQKICQHEKALFTGMI